MIVDSLSNPVCSPCSGLGTIPSPGVIREGFTVRNTWSPHLPIRGVFYPFLSQLPALSSVSENLVLLIDSHSHIHTEKWVADNG